MTYIVTGCDRIQDAVAFIASIVTTNNVSFKEFVSRYQEINEDNPIDVYPYYVELNVNDFMKADKANRNKMLGTTVESI